MKLSLKTLQEFVRLQTFNRSGFQQIQLDMQFLRTPLKEIADDEAAIDFLLDEVTLISRHSTLEILFPQLTFSVCTWLLFSITFELQYILNVATRNNWTYKCILVQVIVAASERCLDSIPLEPPILDKLIQAKLAKAKDQNPMTP